MGSVCVCAHPVMIMSVCTRSRLDVRLPVSVRLCALLRAIPVFLSLSVCLRLSVSVCLSRSLSASAPSGDAGDAAGVGGRAADID